MKDMSWFGFWLFLATLTCCETYLVSTGMDGLFWRYKTAPELQLQQVLIQRAEAGAVKQ